MEKTEFFEKIISHFLKKADIEDMMSYFGSKNYEIILNDIDIKEALEKTINDFNDFFKKNGIDHSLKTETACELVHNGIRKHYTDHNMISIHYDDIYQDFIKNKDRNDYKEHSIFRVENADSIGMYQHFIKIGKPLSSLFDNSYDTPTPGEDGTGFIFFMNSEYRDKSKNLFCGFKDLDQMRNWLSDSDGFIDELISENLVISEYKTKGDSVIFTQKQALFEKDKSVLVNQIKVNDFYKGRAILNDFKHKEDNNLLDENEKEISSFLKEKSGDVMVVKTKRTKNKKRDDFNNKRQLNLF